MRPRHLFLPIAAVVITALCAWKLGREEQSAERRAAADGNGIIQPLPPAFRFELYDQTSQLMRLERYLGRHEIFVIFFDGRAPLENRFLLQLVEAAPALERRNVEVVGVSQALPQENEKVLAALLDALGREPGQHSPVVLVSDLEGRVHRTWGVEPADVFPAADEGGDAAAETVFFIDRAGRIPMLDGAPLPVPDPQTKLAGLVP